MNLRSIVFQLLEQFKGNKTARYIAENYRDSNNLMLFDNVVEHNILVHNLLNYVARTVPFYKHLNGKMNLELEDFPVVNKDIIRESRKKFISCTADENKLIKRFTSGSTGYPFEFFYDNNKLFTNRAAFIFHNNEMGYSVGDKVAYFRRWTKKNKAPWFIMKAKNVIPITATPIESSISSLTKLMREGDTVMWGYVSSMLAYSQLIDKQKDLKAKVVFTGSEILTSESRERLSAFFHSEVFSRYSNEENGIISQQYTMKNDKFRVNTPQVHVEILKLNSNERASFNEVGRVVVTDLCNLSMPFVRYDTGDLSSYSEDDICDSIIIRMNNIQGRVVDSLLRPDGSFVSAYDINNLMYWKENRVLQYQFIQESECNYVMKVVPSEGFEAQVLLNELISIFGNGANLKIEVVNDIPLSASGKRRYIINNYKNAPTKSL